MKLSPERWQEVSPYLDKALSLTGLELSRWFESLRAERSDLADLLDELLIDRHALNREQFLERTAFLNVFAGQRIGEYTVLSLIGQGGMGNVWLAQRSDGRFDRKAAVKFLNAALFGRDGERRFKREGAILAQIEHPNIAELIDAGVTPAGHPYIILEYVDGLPINRYCDDHRLQIRHRILLFIDVLAAIAYAHTHLIVHRDLKPSNILVKADGQVKLLDFGIAKMIIPDGSLDAATVLTRDGGSPLTPQYAAPEQMLGGPITTATDIYALGVLLYELLCGQHPAEGALQSPAELVKAIVNTDPLHPSIVVQRSMRQPEVSSRTASNRATTPDKLQRILRGDLDTIVGKALKKDHRKRYASATALANDLRHYLKYEPISARADTVAYRTFKFIRRNRVSVVLAVLALLGLGLGLTAALWQAHIASRQTLVANSVEHFLEGIFLANTSDQSDPVKARKTTARELLDIGARQIDVELSNVPEAKLGVLGTLGSMYQELGLDDQAAVLLRKRVDLVRAQYGGNSPELASALTAFGGVLYQSSSPAEAGPILLEAKHILDVRHDYRSQLRGDLLSTLAQYYQSSDVPLALAYSKQAVEVHRRFPNDPDLPESLFLQGVMLNNLGQRRSAEECFQEACQASIRSKGDPNSSLPRLYANLGDTQKDLLEFSAAEQSLRRAADTARKLGGDDHIDTMESELLLGTFLATTSRTDEGLKHIADARNTLERLHRTEDPFFAPQVYLVYGFTLANFGRPEDGLPFIVKAVENRRKNRPGTRYLGQMLEQQASVLIDLGRYPEAERAIDEAEQIAKHVKIPPTYLAAKDRARLLIAAGHLNEAEGAINAYHPQAPVAGTLSLDVLRLRIAQAEVAMARNDGQSALKLATEANRDLLSSAIRPYSKTLEASSALVEGRAYLKLDNPSQALPLLERAVELRQGFMDPASPSLADARLALGLCELDLGQTAPAHALRTQALKALVSHRELGREYTQTLREFDSRSRRTRL